MSQLVGVQRICGLLDRGEIDRVEFLVQLTHRMAAEIGCSRAAVRLLIHADEGPALRTIAMHDAASGQPVRVPDMTGGDSAPYFDALLHDGSVVVPDVAATPALAAFIPSYLGPQDVRSLLDVGFSVNGVLYGTFSCEQVGSTMAWTLPQLNLLRQIAARASLTLMHAITAQIDTTPGALWEPSTPNRLMTMPIPLDVKKPN
ncbi:MAG: GAF domain-containing protein [Rhizobacter sp.]